MLNVHLSYKPPISWRILFWSEGRSRQFSWLKSFRSLVVPGGGWRKGIIIQVGYLPSGSLVIGQSCSRIKGDVMGESAHGPRQRNITYIQTVIWSIYDTRCTKHPHSQIFWYQQLPQVSHPCPRYTPLPFSLIQYQRNNNVSSWRNYFVKHKGGISPAVRIGAKWCDAHVALVLEGDK